MSAAAMQSGLEIRRVRDRRDWQPLFDLPDRLPGNDPCWVRPLDSQRRSQWSPRNPWFAHARAQAWLAWRDGRAVGSISAQAWAENWGFVPFTAEEFRHLGRELKSLLGPDYIQIAELDGEPAGFILALPNLNEQIADLDGRLWPLGWMRLLWRLQRSRATTARVPLMGVRRRFHGRAIGAMLAFRLIEALQKPLVRNGIQEVELSWILETNQGMRSLIESIGGRVYKRYRIYDLELDHAGAG